MLQRIQSIYLLLAGLVIFALFLFPLAHHIDIGGVLSTISVTGVHPDSGGAQTQSFTALMVATAVVGLLPFILVFLYKNRKQQITLCYLYILIVIGYSYWQVQTIKSQADVSAFKFDNFWIGVLLCPLSIILTIMASKAIQRDEKLVKSADRLR